MYEALKQKYQKNFVTKEQLIRYVSPGKITKEQYERIVEEHKMSW